MMLRYSGRGVPLETSDIHYLYSGTTEIRKGSLASDLKALMKSEEGADVTLVVDGLQLPAHSQILAARSPVFAAMFRSGMLEVEIADMDEYVLWHMLRFMYRDRDPMWEYRAAKLVAAAEKYELPRLKDWCDLLMSEGLGVLFGETVMAGSQSEKGSLASDLGALLESGDGADVTLVAGGSQLPAHSQILAARSPVFAAMFRSGMLEAVTCRVEIPDMQEDALRQMLWFVYTDTVPEMESMAAELLAPADKYDLPLLKERCELQMARDLNLDTAASTAAMAVVYRCLGLRSAAVRFIAAHLEVLATAGWEKLLRKNADAAVEICRELAVAPPRPPLPNTKVEEAGTVPRDPKSSRLSELQRKQNLWDAAKEGNVKQLRALVAAGANLRFEGPWDPPLHYAASYGHVEATAFLLQIGADLEAKDYDGYTPLSLAAQRGHMAIVRLLLMASADPNNGSRFWWTPLHWAVWYRHIDVVEALLEAGADRSARDRAQRTPLDIAMRYHAPWVSPCNEQQLIEMLS